MEIKKNYDSLKKNSDFQNVYVKGKSKANRYLVMYVAQNNLSINRLGISVSKKVGNSVVRHHLTRLIREAYRLNSNMFNSSLDIVVIARNTAKDKTYKEVESALLHLAKLHNIWMKLGGSFISEIFMGISYIYTYNYNYSHLLLL